MGLFPVTLHAVKLAVLPAWIASPAPFVALLLAMVVSVNEGAAPACMGMG